MKEQIKKVVLAALIAAFGFAAQAELLYWTISDVSSAPNKAMSLNNPYTAYYFIYHQKSSYQSSWLTDIETIIKNQDTSALNSFENANVSGGTNNKYLRSGTGMDGTFKNADFATVLGATTISVIINASSLTDATYYMIAKKDGTGDAYSIVNAISNGDNSRALEINDFGSQANNVWLAIPEPTSGLLLVLGMATLALKRRHA